MSGKHGWVGTREYQAWANMKTRCDNPNYHSYHRYGGRGIGYSSDWSNFLIFLFDMGLCPPGHELDRIDNNSGYSKENCRWVSHTDQGRNTDVVKLTTDKVKVIRALYRATNANCSALRFSNIVAPLYSVSPHTIRNVIRCVSWQLL